MLTGDVGLTGDHTRRDLAASAALRRTTQDPEDVVLGRREILVSRAHRRLGSVVIASMRPNAYSEDQVRFCALVADQIALAMDDARNFQASLRVQERLQLMLDQPAWSRV